MRISTKGRYSLEAMLFLALSPVDEYLSTRRISEATGISEGYLEQLFILLRKASLIVGTRGPQGGYALARKSEAISVGEILIAVEHSLAPVACLVDHSCPSEKSCLSRSVWDLLYKEITACVDSILLSDIAISFTLQEEGEVHI
ncbi:MAG: Rrf2 family transcriptional regulator [Spirochaetales bacterium]|nr:Rrf2 family transcriptional regulator [Spirochaetales bacterium]